MTVDVDGETRGAATVRMLIAHSILERSGARDIRVDLTRRGFHLVAWFAIPVDVDYMRAVAGDCGGRIFVDGLAGEDVSRQILFGVKGGFVVRKGIRVW